jgi:hypothetical protein
MRRVFLSVAFAALLSATSFAADFKDIRTVYVLPMSNGLDQYLAVALTTGNVMQVVADPQKADAILTDHLGETFESKLNDLYGGKPKKEDEGNQQTFARVQGGSHGRNATFLVDRKTRDVLWSVYERPKNNSPDELQKTARRIALKLFKTAGGK